MPQRLRHRRIGYNAKPFAGEGTSVYASAGSTVQYRKIRIIGRHTKWIKGGGELLHNMTKTARRGSAADPTASIPISISDLIPAAGTAVVSFDVRTYKNHVENESDNSRVVTKTIDTAGDEVNAILGTAQAINAEIRAGGIVRIRFVWTAARDGIQPTLFRAVRTAGPSIPPDSTVTYSSGRIIEIDTGELNDGGFYTYKITAENGATTKQVITGITFTADNAGPPTPTLGRSEAV